MALLASPFRSIITIIHHSWFPSPTFISLLPHFSKHPTSTLLLLCRPICSKPCLNPHAINPHSPHSLNGNLLILKQDERFSGSLEKTQLANSSTIAAIVTSLGGPPAAVGIVRLSGPSSVEIVREVFRPMRESRKKKMGNDEEREDSSLWQPTSHVVEYGVVLDLFGNVIDE
ncbi:tRNA modification GTPase MnmE, partial [Bienertia sinuspersici]